ncbi:DNA-methyltransferase [Pectobacterium polaris]|uniref:DNA-methyltransferase n=1 Tax=Pectobacterium polaris TaxID=2042057 RepID=UPI0013FE01B0|nr:site-specific DNA-methyltransferase [Pectobacterium polaris]
MLLCNHLIDLFRKTLGTSWNPNEQLKCKLAEHISAQCIQSIYSEKTLVNNLGFLLNERLQLNQDVFRYVINELAKKGYIFNYHDKLLIQNALNRIDLNFSNWFSKQFPYYCEEKIITHAEEKRNKSFIDVDWHLNDDKKSDDVIESIFSSFIHYAFIKNQEINEDFSIEKLYKESFWEYLKNNNSSQVNRKNGLSIVNVNSIIEQSASYEESLSCIFNVIEDQYATLDNHSYLAFIFDDSIINRWEIIADLSIYAEKFIETTINKKFFEYKKIESDTYSHIKSLDLNKAKFELMSEGFTYKDCYVAYEGEIENIIVLFEKNMRDERIVPCPICRSNNVRGNSYPVLGVKSWECNNIFCGDKSKYNRGKRYSLVSIMRQQAILDDRNIICKEVLKNWRRDVTYIKSKEEIYSFLISCYSLADDTINIINKSEINIMFPFRKILIKNWEARPNLNYYHKYESLHFFSRFLVKKETKSGLSLPMVNITGREDVKLYNGDCFKVLSQLPKGIFDGAVTSPPYYNAKEYSNWKNIYCYLYDMYGMFQETFRTFKEGGVFLFNIFDYFDNENTIVFSQMGKKRIILSSYIVYLAKKAGFKLAGNCVWDKGEVQGNRNFNQGNNSPYYQAPLNCWEHILIFIKLENGKFSSLADNIPRKHKSAPVFKIIKGENTYGHSAPFSKKIPNILLERMGKNSLVLDPYSGSMTTGRAALDFEIKSIGIELHKEYCHLSLRKLEDEEQERKNMLI